MAHDPETLIARFAQRLQEHDPLGSLSRDLVGEGFDVPGPFGSKPLIYADYVASGRALRCIEEAITSEVLPYYANSHTEASYCGQVMNRLRHAARATIARSCKADDGYATIFAGNGATAGLNRLVWLLGVPQAVQSGEKPLVLIGPYEHHSNILPWRESGAEIITIPEAPQGGPDLTALEEQLKAAAGRPVIGAFSAASNVTGIITDTDAVTRLLRHYGARSVWDYAGGGPYLPIDMKAGTDCEKDAVVISTHKFIGGPGASGVLIVRKAAVMTTSPSLAGGGTVRFVSPWGHDYSTSVEAREEAGTPNGIGDIRAALCFVVKDAIGDRVMAQRNTELYDRAHHVWSRNPHIELLGSPTAKRHLPIFSFRVRDAAGGLIHQQMFTRMLSDLYGIQARGGCACAGPYAHALLGIDAAGSDAMRTAILSGEEIEKPGWVRLNFSVLMDDGKVDAIIKAVNTLASEASEKAALYRCDPSTARFTANVSFRAEDVASVSFPLQPS
ncbi:aminotransferase class V-fold PLP-dependent enzyme [Brytella acorum]|uniref:aminotransferase class V-fold PLP-dependent enzyme n=1 Tax=Brytella acorum TaxID=2959299 RepID=UPI0037431051